MLASAVVELHEAKQPTRRRISSTLPSETLPHVDYVLVYDPDDLSMAVPRKLFEDAMDGADLQTERENMGDHCFLKVHVPYHRLAVAAERVKLEIALKDCEIPPMAPSLFGRLTTKFETNNEQDYVSAPFQKQKAHLFLGYNNNPPGDDFFRPAVRSFLCHQILINLDIRDELKAQEAKASRVHFDDLKKRGLLYLLMNKAYTDSFVLHDRSLEEPYYLRMKEKNLQDYNRVAPQLKTDARKQLHESWTRFWRFQPLWKIRNYFGEKGTFLSLLWVPTIVGLSIFLYGLVLSIQKRKIRFCPEPVTTQEPTVSNLTTIGEPPRTTTECSFSTSAELLSEDLLGMIKESFDNIFSAFYALVICLWGSLFLEVWKRKRNRLVYQWDCDNFREHAEPDRPEFIGTVQREDPVTGELSWFYPQLLRFRKFFLSALVVTFMILIVFLSVGGVVIYKVLFRVKYNCTIDHQRDANHPDRSTNPYTCLLVVTIIPSLLNALSIMLLGWFYDRLARKLTSWENHRTQSDFNDALIVKLFAFQFANTYTSLFYIAFLRPEDHGFQDDGILGWGREYRDTCERGSCMTLLSFQVFVLMLLKPIPKFFKDVIWPWIRKRLRRVRKRMRKKRKVQVHEEETRTDSAFTFVNGKRKVGDHFVERNYQQTPLGDFTIGEYTEKVIQFGYIMMFAASFPLAPLFALVIGLFDLRLDATRLLWWNRRPVAFIASDIGMWLSILRFISLVGVLSNAFLVAYTSDFCSYIDVVRCTPADRMWVLIVFEHTALCLMYIIAIAIPDVPAAVKLAQRRERYQVPLVLERGLERSKKSTIASNHPRPSDEGHQLEVPKTEESRLSDNESAKALRHRNTNKHNKPTAAVGLATVFVMRHDGLLNTAPVSDHLVNQSRTRNICCLLHPVTYPTVSKMAATKQRTFRNLCKVWRSAPRKVWIICFCVKE